MNYYYVTAVAHLGVKFEFNAYVVAKDPLGAAMAAYGYHSKCRDWDNLAASCYEFEVTPMMTADKFFKLYGNENFHDKLGYTPWDLESAVRVRL